jgi:hypothetical protein
MEQKVNNEKTVKEKKILVESIIVKQILENVGFAKLSKGYPRFSLERWQNSEPTSLQACC